MQNIIGGNFELMVGIGALSLVRKTNTEKAAHHAFLVLEGVDDNGNRIIMDAHLVVKEGSENKKADIVFRDRTPQQIQEIGDACVAYTWSVNAHQARAFRELVASERQRASQDEISYKITGKTRLTGFVGKSSDNSGLTESKQSLGNASDNACSDFLLNPEGHNCMTWAVGMVQALQLPTPTSWNIFIYADPKELLLEEKAEPNTIKNECRIL